MAFARYSLVCTKSFFNYSHNFLYRGEPNKVRPLGLFLFDYCALARESSFVRQKWCSEIKYAFTHNTTYILVCLLFITLLVLAQTICTSGEVFGLQNMPVNPYRFQVGFDEQYVRTTKLTKKGRHG